MNIVHLCDCMTFMAMCKDKQYDLAIVDPPYAVGASDGNFGRGSKGYKDLHGKYHAPSIYRTDLKHYANHNTVPDKKYFVELFRVSKNQIIWGANYYPQFLFHSGWIIWDKDNIDMPISSDAELAFQSINKLVKIIKIKSNGFLKAKGFFEYTCNKIIHPNQKPVFLYKWLLTNYAKPGQTIFDSHVGSGSIRIACHDLGFDFEGTEIDLDYWEAQEKRYQDHIAQGELFDKKDIQQSIFEQGELL